MLIDHINPLDWESQITLLAAQGYLELGLLDDASREYQNLPYTAQSSIEGLTLLMGIHQATGDSEGLISVAEQLCIIDSDNVERWIDFALVLSKEESLESAKDILLEAVLRFPETALIHFHLARFECGLGNLTLAKEHLGRSRKLCPMCRVLALTDEEDLLPIWVEYSAPKMFFKS